MHLIATLKKPIYNTKIQNKHPAIHKSKSTCGERLIMKMCFKKHFCPSSVIKMCF